jgi:hypothetical protein
VQRARVSSYALPAYLPRLEQLSLPLATVLVLERGQVCELRWAGRQLDRDAVIALIGCVLGFFPGNDE